MKKLLVIFLLVTSTCFAHAEVTPNRCGSLFAKKASFFSRHKAQIIKLSYQIPLTAALSMMIWKEVDQRIFFPAARATIAAKSIEHTNSNKTYYDDLIQHDFRYRNIKKLTLDNDAKKLDERLGNIDVQKRILAYEIQKDYANYYISIRDQSPLRLTLEENIATHLPTPLFKHLTIFLEKGVFAFEGTHVAKEHQKPLTEEQAKFLFDETHRMYLKYFAIDAYLNNYSKETKVFDSPYAKDLLKLESQGKITEKEVIYYLQEDIYHTYFLNILSGLHIHNLKMKDGKYTDNYVTIDDLRAERLTGLNER